MNKIPILAHTAASYAEAIYSLLGKGREHARLLYQSWIRKNTFPFDHPHFKNAQHLLESMVEATDFSFLPLVKKRGESLTEKHLLATPEGLEIEMVTLPMKAGWTLCISSQVGCKMGCAFCETGKMGLLRSLSAQEILSQVYQAKHGLKLPIRNLVFMGMGEPLDNYENVMQAVKVLTDMEGFAFGPSRITLSTSGLVDKIYQLIEDADPALNLAVSVNSSNDAMRNRLMPVNRSFDMARLKEAMLAYTAHPRRKIFIEYVLIKGRTDSIESAQELAQYLHGLNVTVNLIPYNPQSRGRFEAPDNVAVDAFADALRSQGYLVFVRSTKGQKIMAACGQLGNPNKKKLLVFSQ